MPSGLPLVCLHPISVVEPGGTSKVPVSGSDRLSPAREEKLWWKICLHPHLEQGGTPPVESSHGCGCHFFLSYRWELAVPEPLLYNVFKKKNWDKLDPQNLKKKTRLIFFCDTEWPQYPLEEGERWPVEGYLNYNIVLQLDWFCRKQGKWVEVPYVLRFFSL